MYTCFIHVMLYIGYILFSTLSVCTFNVYFSYHCILWMVISISYCGIFVLSIAALLIMTSSVLHRIQALQLVLEQLDSNHVSWGDANRLLGRRVQVSMISIVIRNTESRC